MAFYLRNWMSYAAGSLGIVEATPTVAHIETPEIDVIAPQTDEDDDAATIKGDQSSEDEDENAIPVFPALNSAQRISSSQPATVRTDLSVLTDAQRMPPPPLPTALTPRRPGVSNLPNSLTVPSSSLGVPSGSNALGLPPAAKPLPKKKSRKVALAPGHGPLDWANLQKSGQDLRGVRQVSVVYPHADGV
jgi:hypothetical protein